jgi:NAD(P)-dependent dehydrogenase (short-subunit alcohol dehydrogenase family)
MERSVVLVTGSSRGIGRATAVLLAERGYRVFGTTRKLADAQVDGVQMLTLDVTRDESVAACVAAVLERAGRIDVLVNNAAVGLMGAIEETPGRDAADLFDVNVFGAARMICAVLPGMRARRDGLIINLGSLAPAVPTPFHGYLSASKAAVSTLSDALRLEVRHLGIAVTCVEPGATATHPGAEFTALKAAGVGSIGDYARQEGEALGVYEHGQQAGGDPRAVAATILEIVETTAPARSYVAGSEKERWIVRASRLLPRSTVETLAAHHFHVSH